MESERHYRTGDRVYIVANNVKVQQLEVMSVQGDFYTLRNLETYGAMRLRGNRLFATREDAEQALREAEARSNNLRGRSSGRDQHWL